MHPGRVPVEVQKTQASDDSNIYRLSLVIATDTFFSVPLELVFPSPCQSRSCLSVSEGVHSAVAAIVLTRSKRSHQGKHLLVELCNPPLTVVPLGLKETEGSQFVHRHVKVHDGCFVWRDVWVGPTYERLGISGVDGNNNCYLRTTKTLSTSTTTTTSATKTTKVWR